jgi:hypothetical protein
MKDVNRSTGRSTRTLRRVFAPSSRGFIISSGKSDVERDLARAEMSMVAKSISFPATTTAPATSLPSSSATSLRCGLQSRFRGKEGEFWEASVVEASVEITEAVGRYSRGAAAL